MDKEKYKWLHLPNAGGYYDQDEYILTVWEIIKFAYIDAMNDPDIIAEIERNRIARQKKLQSELSKRK